MIWALLPVIALAGCGSGAVKADPAVSAKSSACTRAAKHWPATVADQKVRDTTADSPTVKAWGDPAIIARCGVDPPGPNTKCVTVSGIDWVVISLSDGKKLVTFGRDPAIEVLVPHKYAPAPLVLGAFTKAAQQIPQGAHHCT